jgi:hypothetical protein
MRVIELDRAEFLRFGAGGLVVAAATGLLPAAAGAQLPAPAPQEDDVAYLSFATVAEGASRDFYRAAHNQAGTGLSAAERRHIDRVASAKRAHVLRLNGVGFATDPATRLFLGRLLAYDAEQLAWLRAAAGRASPAGLLSPIDLEPASDRLDAFLSTPDFPD